MCADPVLFWEGCGYPDSVWLASARRDAGGLEEQHSPRLQDLVHVQLSNNATSTTLSQILKQYKVKVMPQFHGAQKPWPFHWVS